MNRSRYVSRPLDTTDQAIIAALSENGRMTVRDLAAQIGLSSPSITERIHKLEDAGAIRGYMAQQTGHSVGVVGGHVPIFGWNRSGGDLRIAHFLGIHAQQAVPILGMLVVVLPAKVRWTVLLGGSMVYVAIVVVVFLEAIARRPLMAV